MRSIDEYLSLMIERDASDLHFMANDLPRMRQYGVLMPAENEALDADGVHQALETIITPKARQELENSNGADFAYALPGNVRIVEVEFPMGGKIGSGRADIRFYKTGHTDKALIHLDDGERQLSFLIEPFLTKVKVFEKYASFED